MLNSNPSRIILPALRGILGNRIFYSCLMDIRQLITRIKNIDKQPNNQPSQEEIENQLDIKKQDARKSEYSTKHKDLLLNFFVIAVQGGNPEWHAISNINCKNEELQNLDSEIIASMGFLTLQGNENLFVLTGQDQLAHIKENLGNELEHNSYNEVSVIFIAFHEETER